MSDLRVLSLASGALDDLRKEAFLGKLFGKGGKAVASEAAEAVAKKPGFLGQAAKIPGQVIGTGLEQTGKLVKDHPGTALGLAATGVGAKVTHDKYKNMGMTGNAYSPSALQYGRY